MALVWELQGASVGNACSPPHWWVSTPASVLHSTSPTLWQLPADAATSPREPTRRWACTGHHSLCTCISGVWGPVAVSPALLWLRWDLTPRPKKERNSRCHIYYFFWNLQTILLWNNILHDLLTLLEVIWARWEVSMCYTLREFGDMGTINQTVQVRMCSPS
jgi:hypothetical protein